MAGSVRGSQDTLRALGELAGPLRFQATGGGGRPSAVLPIAYGWARLRVAFGCDHTSCTVSLNPARQSQGQPQASDQPLSRHVEADLGSRQWASGQWKGHCLTPGLALGLLRKDLSTWAPADG